MNALRWRRERQYWLLHHPPPETLRLMRPYAGPAPTGMQSLSGDAALRSKTVDASVLHELKAEVGRYVPDAQSWYDRA
jgi:hypothetical protein